MSRFKVATVNGDLSPRPSDNKGALGLSAHVLDTLYCHNVVATFRSEDRFWTGLVRGRNGAIRDAEKLAADLNAAE